MASTRSRRDAPVNRAGEPADLRQLPLHRDADTPDPYSGESKWPAWVVTLAVVMFCSAFWAGAGYIITELF